jgi:hypothetical protein
VTDFDQFPTLRRLGDALTLLDAEQTSQPWSRRKHVRISALALCILCLGSGVAWAVFRPEPQVTATIGCATDGSQTGVVAFQPDGRAAVEICRDLWRTGGVLPSVRAAPELTPCVANEASPGAIIVFPTSDTGVCQRNGKVLADDDAGLNSGTYARVASALWATEKSCPSPAEALATAKRLIAKNGLGWTVIVTRGTPRDACALFSFGSGRKLVVISGDRAEQ